MSTSSLMRRAGPLLVPGALAVASCGIVAALAPPATAGAQSVSSLQEQAAQVSHQLNVEQSQLVIDQERYFTAAQKVGQDEQAVAAMQAQIDAVQARTRTDSQHLRDVAIQAYVHDGSGTDNVIDAFTGSSGAQAARTVYQQVAAGDVAVAVAQLQTDRGILQLQESDLQRVTSQDEADRQVANSIVSQTQSVTEQLSQQSAEISGQLAVAVAQERAAQAAAAAAAVQAMNARAALVATNAANTPSTSGAAPSPSDPGIGDWQRVATCEEGGQNDATYGYFGITPQSWAAYGGTQYSGTAGGASQAEQVVIANRISGGSVPDANGCASW